MPRVSRQQAERHRADIEEASSRLFREHGIDGVSVADLMAAAGLTHGGFYGHFQSKEALAACACERAFDHAADRWRRLAAADPSGAHDTIVERYLSVASRDAAGSACPVPSLAADVARTPASAAVRASYHAGIERLLAILSSLQDGRDEDTCRQAALVELATLTGAILLARATSGRPCSTEILAAAKHALCGHAREDRT